MSLGIARTDVDAILAAWHERHITAHLHQLAALRNGAGSPSELDAVLTAYSFISHHRGHHGAELASLLHQGEAVRRARQQLVDLLRDLLTEVAEAGGLRGDVSTAELASYCTHALTAASALPRRQRSTAWPESHCAACSRSTESGRGPHRRACSSTASKRRYQRDGLRPGRDASSSTIP
ncbi:hypothetical protein [Streptomyces sp. NPDC006463]|uniref:hypothetical protein n=1 Tax=Streptomyces sp. NPDC006463 TaxID=3364746 RepID=UPI0036802426